MSWTAAAWAVWWPSLALLWCVNDFLKMRHRAADVVSQVSDGGEESVPSKPASGTQPSLQPGTFSPRAHGWLAFNLSTTTLSSFSTKLFSMQSVPSLSHCVGLCQPSCRALHLPLLNFMRSPRAHFSSLTRSVWVAALPSSVSATPPNLVSPTNVLRGHSIPSPWSLHHQFQESLYRM